MRTSAGPFATRVWNLFVRVARRGEDSKGGTYYEWDFDALRFELEADQIPTSKWGTARKYLEVLREAMTRERATDYEPAAPAPQYEPEWLELWELFGEAGPGEVGRDLEGDDDTDGDAGELER